MNHEDITLGKFTIVGISIRTTNQELKSQADIANLWQEFFRNAIVQNLPNKESDDVYCIYTDYESDYTGEYTTLIGYKVSSLECIPTNQNLTIKEFPQSRYYKYISEGELPYVVGKTWAYIWKSNINRQYSADFDVYGKEAKNPAKAKVITYLSVN